MENRKSKPYGGIGDIFGISTRSPNPETRNPKPETRSPKPETPENDKAEMPRTLQQGDA
jgi:hypothetical protein